MEAGDSERLPADGRQDGVDEVQQSGHVGEDLQRKSRRHMSPSGQHVQVKVWTHHRRDVQLVVLEVPAVFHVQSNFSQ